MKKNIRKFLAAVSAAVLCAVPMMNGINASAGYSSTDETGSFIVWRGNVDGNHVYDVNDYMILKEYFQAKQSNNTAKVSEMRNKYRSIRCDEPYYDMNGDGKKDEVDLDYFKYIYTHYSNYDDAARWFFGSGSCAEAGDANGDLIIDMSDVVTIEQYLIDPVKYPTANIMFKCANYDNTGVSKNKITVEDVVALQLKLEGLEKSSKLYIYYRTNRRTGKSELVVSTKYVANAQVVNAYDYYLAKEKEALGIQ